MSRLEVRALSRYDPAYGTTIEDVSFTVEDGRVCVIVAPPGSGTTTTLRQIAGLDRPDAGDVLLGERTLAPVPPHRRGIGLVTGDPALFPDRDVRGNVEFGLRMRGWPRNDRDRRAGELLQRFGLTEVARRRVDTLSDVDRLRVALARALAPRPALLLLDAPLARIDEAYRPALRAELRSVLREVGATVIVATPDLRDAVALADDLVVMDEGRVLQEGPLQRVLAGPASVRVAALVGYATLITGEVHDGRVVEEGVGAMRIPEGFPLDRAAVVLAHPSTLLAVPPNLNLGSGVIGEVVTVRPDGPMHLLDLQIGDRRLEARWEWDLRPPALGTRLEIAARPGTLRYFNAPWPPVPPLPGPEPGGEGTPGEDIETAIPSDGGELRTDEVEPQAEETVDGDEAPERVEPPASAVPPRRHATENADGTATPPETAGSTGPGAPGEQTPAARHPSMPAFE